MTPEQVELFVWMVESAPEGAVLFIETAPLADSGKTEATLGVPDGCTAQRTRRASASW